MLTAINDAILTIADPLLAWLLWLPTDIALILVSVATGAVLTFIRPWATDQDLLRRCHEDKRRLKQLIKEARNEKNKEAIRRYKTSIGMITFKTLRSEGLPLLLAIVPVAILAVWCFHRLEFYPPKADEPITIHAYFPVSAAGNPAHIAPQDGVTADGRWIRLVVAVTDPAEGAPHGMATWHLRAKARTEPYTLEMRRKLETVTKRLLVGQRTYEPAVEFYSPDSPVECIEVKMRQVKLFGVVPGIPRQVELFGYVIWLVPVAPWLVAYFLIAIPAVFWIKWLAEIY